MANIIADTYGIHFFLNNDFYAPIQGTNGVTWTTAAHAIAAAQTTDPAWKKRIRLATYPWDARGVLLQAPTRLDWDTIKEDVVETITKVKYSQHPDIASMLVSTEQATLLMWNLEHDNYWGNCDCKDCAQIDGKNRLGIIIMKIREKYQDGQQTNF